MLTGQKDVDADGNVLHDFGYSYDLAGNITEKSETDPMDNTTVYHYNALRQADTITDAAGGVEKYTYNAKELLASRVDAADCSGFCAH